jgi:carbon storage regulator
MLILARKPGESVVIDGRIVVTVMRQEGDVVKIGIEAPVDVPIHRREVYDEIQRNNREAVARAKTSVPKLAVISGSR